LTIREQIEATARTAPSGLVVDWGLGNPARQPPLKARMVRAKVADVYGGNFYAPGRGVPETLEAVAKFSADVDGVRLDPQKNIFISEAGTCWFLELLLKALLQDESSRPVHVYLPVPYYARHVEATKLPCVETHLIRYGHRRYADCLIEELEQAHSGVAVINSFDNPTTTLITEDEMRRVFEATDKRNVVLFADDAYRHVYRRNPVPSIFKAVPQAIRGKVVSTLSWSKALQWPGLKGGALLGNEGIVEQVFRAKSRISEGGDPATQAAMAAAVLEYEFFEETREEYRRLEAMIVEGLQEAGWDDAARNDGTLFLRLPVPSRLRERGLSSHQASMELANLGIVTYPFEMFGGQDQIRLCMKGSDGEIALAIRRIKGLLRG
jgi:N-succinyldiaminopimelate aminotransferase